MFYVHYILELYPGAPARDSLFKRLYFKILKFKLCRVNAFFSVFYAFLIPFQSTYKTREPHQWTAKLSLACLIGYGEVLLAFLNLFFCFNKFAIYEFQRDPKLCLYVSKRYLSTKVLDIKVVLSKQSFSY